MVRRLEELLDKDVGGKLVGIIPCSKQGPKCALNADVGKVGGKGP